MFGKKLQKNNAAAYNFTFIDDLAPGGECPFLGKEVWVASDGRFNPCCAPDKERRALGDVGNFNTNSLTEILSSESYKALQKD